MYVSRYGKAVVEAVIVRWKSLSCWWEDSTATFDSKMMALTVLTKLLIIDASFIANEGHPAYRPIWAMYCGMLTDRTTTLPFKVSYFYFRLIQLAVWDWDLIGCW